MQPAGRDEDCAGTGRLWQALAGSGRQSAVQYKRYSVTTSRGGRFSRQRATKAQGRYTMYQVYPGVPRCTRPDKAQASTVTKAEITRVIHVTPSPTTAAKQCKEAKKSKESTEERLGGSNSRCS